MHISKLDMLLIYLTKYTEYFFCFLQYFIKHIRRLYELKMKLYLQWVKKPDWSFLSPLDWRRLKTVVMDDSFTFTSCWFSEMTPTTISFWKRWAYQTIWPASWETCIQVRKQQLKLDMEQHTGSK